MRILIRHLRHHAVAYLALVLAISGASAAAAAAVYLPDNSVGTRQLQDGAVTARKVHPHLLSARDFKTGQLPKGPRGYTGPPGPQGLKGDTGAIGALGALVRTVTLTGLIAGSQSVRATLASGPSAVVLHPATSPALTA